MHERDVANAIVLALKARIRGVYNVAGPQPVPLSLLIRDTGRKQIPLPEFVFANLLGRFGLPRLPKGALMHIKYPVVIDSEPFRKATGFAHEVSEVQSISEYRSAFPLPRGGRAA